MPFGRCCVFYPEISDDKCTVALALDVDAVGLVRGKGDGGRWSQYVNDRPYVASSFLSSSMLEMFRTAMTGRSKERQELADSELPLSFELPVLKCRGGEGFLRRLFEPLGYEVTADRLPLDEKFAEWGESAYFSVKLNTTKRLAEALTHLYVLIPVLDDDKHYWVNKDEIEKLVLKGGDWLKKHPEKEEITNRYLLRQRNLTRDALQRLAEVEDPDAVEEALDAELEKLERPLSLHDQRLGAVVAAIRESGAQRVLDLGCGEGKLIKLLLKEKGISQIVGMDVALSSLEKVKRTIRWDQLSDRQQSRVSLVHGSLTYRDKNLAGFDAAALVEVIEHLDLARLSSLVRVVFESARPRTVVITTPNREYNALFEGMQEGAMRHKDHRFEWNREEFKTWAEQVAEAHEYQVKISNIGPVDDALGAPSQMGVFTR